MTLIEGTAAMSWNAIDMLAGVMLFVMGVLMIWQPGRLVRDFTSRKVLFGDPLSERATGLLLRYALGPIMLLTGAAALYMLWYTTH